MDTVCLWAMVLDVGVECGWWVCEVVVSVVVAWARGLWWWCGVWVVLLCIVGYVWGAVDGWVVIVLSLLSNCLCCMLLLYCGYC